MFSAMLITSKDVQQHFYKRALGYKKSAYWVENQELFKLYTRVVKVNDGDKVLDVGCGTGLIGSLFRKRGVLIVGVDFTIEMMRKALPRLDFLVKSNIEEIPFSNDIFNLIVCRQALQFVDYRMVVKEMFRVCKPGGKILLSQLAAHSKEDKKWAFKIQRMRQPMRKNCFLEEDLVNILREVGCSNIQSFPYYYYEFINKWINYGILSQKLQKEIIEVYKQTSSSFLKIHEVAFSDSLIRDKMKISTVVGSKLLKRE